MPYKTDEIHRNQVVTIDTVRIVDCHFPLPLTQNLSFKFDYEDSEIAGRCIWQSCSSFRELQKASWIHFIGFKTE